MSEIKTYRVLIFRPIAMLLFLLLFGGITGWTQKTKSKKKPGIVVGNWILKKRSQWTKTDSLEHLRDSLRLQEQWIKDSLELAKEWQKDSLRLQEEWIKDSLQSAREWQKDSLRLHEQWIKDSIYRDRFYENKFNPPDSLSFVDKAMSKIIADSTIIHPDSLAAVIKRRFKTPFQRTRAAFNWIARMVTYDHESFRNNSVLTMGNRDINALSTFLSKKGVCQNYANLFRYVLTKMDIENEVVSGYGKNYPYGIVQGNDTDHAWNVVKLGKEWRLFDVTWASDGNTEVDNYWFNTPPAQFIYNHFPSDTAWQLVGKKVSFQEFKNFPVVSSTFFKSHAAVTIPAKGFMSGQSAVLSLELKKGIRKYDLLFDLIPYQGNDWRKFSKEIIPEEMQTTVRKNTAKDYAVFDAVIPRKGTWWIRVSVVEKTGDKICPEIEFPNCLYFGVTYY